MSDIIFEAKRLQNLAGLLIEETRNISYMAIVLYKDSHLKLISSLEDLIPKDWKIVAHHVTINMKSFAGDIKLLNSNHLVEVNSFVINDKVCACGVKIITGIISENENPHITLAINKAADAKAKDSNNKKLWENAKRINSLILEGKLVEVAKGESFFAENYPTAET